MEDSGELFDFGFSFDEEKIDDVSEEIQMQKELDDLKHRLSEVKLLVFSFLDNLAKNPEKETIRWPNRADKIKEFKSRIDQIIEGQI